MYGRAARTVSVATSTGGGEAGARGRERRRAAERRPFCPLPKFGLARAAVQLELGHVREGTAGLVRIRAGATARSRELLAQHREADVADARRAGGRLHEIQSAAVGVAER